MFTRTLSMGLQEDLPVMRQTRHDLAAEVAQLTSMRREQEAVADQSRQLAEEFRAAYSEAISNDGFPIEVRGQAYTQRQVPDTDSAPRDLGHRRSFDRHAAHGDLAGSATRKRTGSTVQALNQA